MDIHKPKAIHSWREFAVEIGTITIGILIALGLEALIEARHNHELVAEARAELISELQYNRKNLADVIVVARNNQAALKALISYGQARLAHRAAALPSGVDLNGRFTTLRTSGWESTVATQAIAHMPYDQAQAVASVYASSRGFNDLEARIEPRWFELARYGGEIESMPDADVRRALGDLRVLLSYQTAAATSGSETLAEYDRALSILKR